MDAVDVMLTGRLLPGTDPERAAAALAQMTGLAQDKALALLTSGKPRLAKRALEPDEAQVFVDRFAELGIETSLRPAAGSAPKSAETAAPPQPAAPTPAPEPPPQAEAPPAPASDAAADDVALSVAAQPTDGSAGAPEAESAANDAEEEVNPYAPPKADLTQKPRREGEGRWSDAPADASAAHGFEWFREAWALFSSRPKIWLGPLGAVALIYFIVMLVPRGGSVALNLILPILAGGVAMTAHRLAEDEEAEAKSVNPFADRRVVRALINISLLCALYQLVVVLLLAFTLGPAVLAGRLPALGPGTALFGLILLVILLAPQYLFALFCPSLVALGELGAIAAMKAAIRGGLKNWQAILLNALVSAIAAMLSFTLLMLLAGLVGEGGGLAETAVIALLCAVVFAPLWGIFALMSYFATREVFYEEDH